MEMKSKNNSRRLEHFEPQVQPGKLYLKSRYVDIIDVYVGKLINNRVEEECEIKR